MPSNAFMQGIEFGSGIQKRRASRDAARYMLQDRGADPLAAEQALLAAGEVEGALGIRESVQKQATAQSAASKDSIVRLLRSARAVPEPERIKRLPEIFQAARTLAIPEPVIKQMEAGGADDWSDTALEQALVLTGEAPTPPEEFDLREINGDLYRTGKRSGKSTVLVDNPDRPMVTPFGILLPPGSPAAQGRAGAPAAAPATPAAAMPSGPMAPPVAGRVTSRFGEARVKGPHNGTDWAAAAGTPVVARAPGKVVDVGYNDRAGHYVIVQHADGSRMGVAHLQSPPNLAMGQPVQPGETLGAVGATGNATGPHAHVTYRDPQGNRVDPESVFGGGGREDVGGGAADDQLQEVGGGWTLQTMQTPGQQQSTQRDERDFAYRRSNDAESRAMERERLDLARRADARSAETTRSDRSKAATEIKTKFENEKPVQDFRAIQSAWKTMRRLTNKPKPTGQDDIALIMAFNKVMDPGSVVKEGEFDRAAMAAGVSQSAIRQYEKTKSGNLLTPRMRREIINAAAEMVMAKRESFDEHAGTWRQLAQQQGVNPDLLTEQPGAWRKRIKPTTPTGQTFNTSAGRVTVGPPIR